MTDLRVIPWIRSHSDAEAVGLARALIFAEVGRLSLSRSDFSISANVRVADQGIDGRTHFPMGSGCLLPEGPAVWQVKSGRTAPSANTEFNQERHAALINAIKGGYNYVLFWTFDPVDPVRQTVIESFRATVKKVREDAEVTFLFAESIESFCYSHPAILAQSPDTLLRGVLSLPRWGCGQNFDIPFQPDDNRMSALDVIQAHVRHEDAYSSSIHIYGDTGVGKSRLVYEALVGEDIADRVLVAIDPQVLDPAFLTSIIASDDRRVILVVDDCAPDQRRLLAQQTDMARGRIRLITIGSRYNRDPQPSDSSYLELGPLSVGASREIALRAGVSPEQADTIAAYTEGYPKLAAVLAGAVRRGRRDAQLVERIQGEAVGSVLSTMLTDREDTSLLGVLALFERLGFDADLAHETTIACEIFAVDERLFRDVVIRETGRFVSQAGRYRLVTPRLFAIWLATRVIRQRLDMAEVLKRLPETLKERIVDQMSSFAGDCRVAAALNALVESGPFGSGVLEDVDEGSARLLHVAAIVDPELAIIAIERMLSTPSLDEIQRGLNRGRRGIVQALEVLVWFDKYFERAAAMLLRLALAENETWANNATGLLQGVFRVHLGGTSAPYEKRIAWARQTILIQPQAMGLLVEALANALEVYEMRTSTDFASRTVPQEWRPQSLDEEVLTRRSAWVLLMDVAKTEQGRLVVGKEIAPKLRDAAARGLLGDIIESLSAFEWPPVTRVKMAESLGS